MRHVSSKDFVWKEDVLLFEGNPFMGISKHPVHQNMWYVVYPDKALSLDFYNKTRVKDNCVTAAMRIKGKEWEQDGQETALQ